MGMDKKKKAAVAAVMQYLETERQQLAVAGVPSRVVAIPDRSALFMPIPYSLSGRNAAMQVRTLMQYRALRG